MGLSSKDWALRWVRGSLESYVRGKRTLDNAMGVVKRAVESYGVSPGEVLGVIDYVVRVELPAVPRSVKEEKLRPIVEYLEKMPKQNGQRS